MYLIKLLLSVHCIEILTLLSIDILLHMTRQGPATFILTWKQQRFQYIIIDQG